MMHRNIRRCLLGTAFAGGLVALGGVAANAADTTSGTDGLLSGTQVVAPVNVPISLGATSVGLLGDSAANAENTGAPSPAPAPAASTSGSDGILSGTQVVAPVNVPISLGATSVGLLGDSAANTEGAGNTGTAPVSAPAPAANTSGSDGILSGTQIVAPITAPVSLGATSVGLLGDSAANTEGAGNTGTAPVSAPAPAAATSGSDGILSGTQVVAPITAPTNLGATSVGLLGDSAASAENTGAPSPAPALAANTSGSDGILSGTQVVAPITAPVSLGATSVGLLGDSAANTEGAGNTGTAPVSAPAPAAATSGADGILSGTQVVAPITAPVSLGATSVGLLGDSAANTEGAGNTGTAPVSAPAPAAATSGADGILSGTQVVAPVNVPISLGATSVGLLGDSTASAENTGAPSPAPAPAAATSGADGILSGTQVVAPITAPTNLGVTSVGLTGQSTSTVVTPPVVAPPVVATPVVTIPAIISPVTAFPAAQPSAGGTEVRAAATNTAPMSTGSSSAPTVLANTGVNSGMLLVGLLLLAFGGVLTLVLRRKRS
ncbi:hypothetical protein QFZ35_000631 [Arthrobacter ulcerisalmonis]|nr:hypothetical protein [Arthrobacter ulcerisalmonis]MDQ0662133.1 hypothetical protein [Arthrobacter ulcerisalmonis]